MDLACFIRNRVKQLRLPQRDLARATRMAELYISELQGPNTLTTPPTRTVADDQLERVLQLPRGTFPLVSRGHRERLKQQSNNQPSPLLHRHDRAVLRYLK